MTGFFASGAGSFWDKLTGPYTALPTLIFDWSRQPTEAVQANAAAAIIVLMVLILLVNGTAIILRNRYARKW